MLCSGLIILAGTAMMAFDKARFPKPEKSQIAPEKKYTEFHPVQSESLHEPVEA